MSEATSAVQYISTRDATRTVGIREALEAGLAPDGGLFVPDHFPKFRAEDFRAGLSLAEFAPIVLAPFFGTDSELSTALPEICRSAFNFPTPIFRVPGEGHSGDFILELYHGPTCAFKDVGARFLAGVMTLKQDNKVKRTVIVATSGDTGGAVAAAFHRKPDIEVVILYPKGMVSPRQEHQLCAWGDNVRAFEVKGTFDDCQRVVKEALGSTATASAASASNRKWLSANSINLGRILPQMTYYAWASLERFRKNGGVAPGFIVPSGNLGNSLAAVWAKKAGFPIGKVVLALNSNRGVADYLQSGVLKAARAVPTLANAMDVGNPSNLERLRSLYPDVGVLREVVEAFSFSDQEISNEIRGSEREWGQILCPHSAVATLARRRLPAGGEWIMVATAHPAKFETIVEPLIGKKVELPAALREILKRPAEKSTIPASYAELVSALRS
jgi:threonine synthase